MFDLGWSEILVIGVVALIVVGPKDLPKMFRTLGQLTAKARSMAREFTRAMEDAAEQSGVKDVARDLRGATNPQSMGLDDLNAFKNWDPLKDDPKTTTAAAPADDEDEMDRIAAEMDAVRKSGTPPTKPEPAPEPVAKPDPIAKAPAGDMDKPA